jgi:hypothetical protein
MGDNINGHFFLGSGYVSDENVYSFYVKSGNGYYSDQIYAADAFIVETTDEPRIEVYKDYTKSWVLPKWIDTASVHYVVYVPPGSIKPLVNMDLPK